ncbi:hypothetical protein [Gracilibacillus sp. YIM 98692]|uniref:hypothetical protein n=1 Tax=Gracilibacillus sp. YIM 98692 TaxID=2663532 RepID=UPI0013D85E35|nr:hypothetical protein [Gracilibacillus sp. YIM 98692]
MWRKILITLVLILGVTWLFGFFIKESMTTSLVETVKIKEQYEDFIVHVRIEETTEGFQVLRSLEYIGEEEVEIKHRTPLTQVTFTKDNGTFTGSHVQNTLKPGYSYHPQQPLHMSPLNKGRHTVYIHSQFMVDGKEVNIKGQGTIVFE